MTYKTKISLLLIAVCVLAGAAAYVYVFIYNKPHTDYLGEEAQYKIDAASLYDAFISDQSQAELKYSGVVVQVSGKVSDVEKTDEMVFIIISFEEGLFGPQGIRFLMLDDFAKRATNLAPGDFVEIKGFCSGFTGSDVIIEHCSLVN